MARDPTTDELERRLADAGFRRRRVARAVRGFFISWALCILVGFLLYLREEMNPHGALSAIGLIYPVVGGIAGIPVALVVATWLAMNTPRNAP